MGLQQSRATSRKLSPIGIRPAEILDIALAAAGLSFAAYFLLAWLFTPSWIHIDVVISSQNYVLKPGESFLSSFPEHVFNLEITESAFYRPRFLSFLVEYVDMNLARRIHDAFPQLGIKLPSYGFSIIATVAAFVWFWRSLTPRTGYGLALIGGASLLYCDVYMNTSFMVLRGGKFLNSAAGLFCMTIFIRYMRRDFSPKDAAISVAISVVLFALMAMDEQITALVAFIACVAVVVAGMRKRVSQASVMFALAALSYALYYVSWGRWLFARYTPGGLNQEAHYHKFSDVFRVDSSRVSQALDMLLANMTALGIASLILLAVYVASVARIAWRPDERFQRLFVCVAFALFPVALTTVMVTSHGDIYLKKTLWTLFYLALPVHTLIAVVAWSAALAEFRTDMVRIALAIAFLFICVTGVYKLRPLHEAACETTIQDIIVQDSSWRGYGCGMNPVFP